MELVDDSLFSTFLGLLWFHNILPGKPQKLIFNDNTNYSSGIQVGGNDIVPLLRHHKLVPEPADNHYKVSQGIMVEFPNL